MTVAPTAATSSAPEPARSAPAGIAGQVEVKVTESAGTSSSQAGRTGRARVETDPVSLLLDREQARHHAELVQTREQVAGLLACPTGSLLTALDTDLAAVATTAIEAMAVLRRHPEPELTADQIDEVSGAVGDYLATVARQCRSILAIHLTLEAQVRSDTS